MRWVVFNAVVLVLLAVDLGVFHRSPHRVSAREAAAWSVVWVALSVGFGLWVWSAMGEGAGMQFLAGYLVEKALSVDNVFVFVLAFSYFQVPAAHQHRVLFWGVLGAIVMRGAMIAAGAYLLERFHWILYVFGGFLVLTGVRLATRHGHSFDPAANPVLRLVRRMVPVATSYDGHRFFTRGGNDRAVGTRWIVTPLFLVLMLVESTDLVFALDSIPAIFAVTSDPFLVYTSNVCAILGLRTLYFLVADVVHRFRYLQAGLSAVLVFVGAKMLLADVYEVSIAVSFSVIAAMLAVSIGASLAFPYPSTHDSPDSREVRART